MELPVDISHLSDAKSQQLLGWIYMTLQSGKTVDAAEWNRAVKELTKEAA